MAPSYLTSSPVWLLLWLRRFAGHMAYKQDVRDPGSKQEVELFFQCSHGDARIGVDTWHRWNKLDVPGQAEVA